MEVLNQELEIERVKEHISRIFPHANSVDVKVDKVPKKGFRSLIEVRAPQKKRLVALKTDRDIKKSLEKSHLAIVRQIHKLKTKWRREGQRRSHLMKLSA
jgi:ribosome-associated translation inhibitor RaiA